MMQYQKMKDSGLRWIGKVPEKWGMKRLKFISKFELSSVDRHENDGELQVSICHYPEVYNNEKITKNTLLSKGTCTLQEFNKFRLKKDDVIITKDSETPDDIGVPAYVEEDVKNAVCGYHLAQLNTDKNQIQGSFLFTFMKSNFANAYFETCANGVTRYGLGKDSIGSIIIPLPSVPEQEFIYKFLDMKTFKIDSDIQKNQKLIELLKEKRQAIIDKIITKGLDPNVQLKNSGEWIGDIPEHWKVEKIKWMLSDHRQGFYTEDEYVENNGIKLVRITDINDNGDITYDDCPLVSISEKNAEIFSVKNGDFLFARSGTIGRFGLSKCPPDCIFASYLIRFRFSKYDSNFLKYSFLSDYFKKSLISMLHGGANKNIHAENIKEIKVTFPKLVTEQKQISDFLDKQTFKIDSLIQKTESQIEKLEEFRRAIISEVVTGKIDVRKAIIA